LAAAADDRGHRRGERGPGGDAVIRPAIALATALAVALMLSACAGDATDPSASLGSRQILATGIGAGAGGLIGNQFGRGSGKAAMTGLGTLIGGAAGLLLSQPARPVPQVQTPQPVCRETTGSALISGRAEQVNGVACLGPDGIWRRQP
jgi:surface antigen